MAKRVAGWWKRDLVTYQPAWKVASGVVNKWVGSPRTMSLVTCGVWGLWCRKWISQLAHWLPHCWWGAGEKKPQTITLRVWRFWETAWRFSDDYGEWLVNTIQFDFRPQTLNFSRHRAERVKYQVGFDVPANGIQTRYLNFIYKLDVNLIYKLHMQTWCLTSYAELILELDIQLDMQMMWKLHVRLICKLDVPRGTWLMFNFI